MAGHFIVTSFTYSDLMTAQGAALGANWSPVQHAHVGWNAASRGVLTSALAGDNIGNRAGLPPHRYLLIAAAAAGSAEARYLNGCGWGERLQRPAAPGLGLRALTGPAQAAFAGGNPNAALALQAQNGNVSIEIYYLSGYEMS